MIIAARVSLFTIIIIDSIPPFSSRSVRRVRDTLLPLAGCAKVRDLGAGHRATREHETRPRYRNRQSQHVLKPARNTFEKQKKKKERKIPRLTLPCSFKD